MLKFKLPQRPIRPKELFPLPVDSFPSPARPFPTHMGVMFTPRGFSTPLPLCRRNTWSLYCDTVQAFISTTEWTLYLHINTLFSVFASLNFKPMPFFLYLKQIQKEKKSSSERVLMNSDSSTCAIILILFPFSHLCSLVSLTNAALLLWH